MIYTAFLRSIFRAVYGEPVEGDESPGAGLILVADGIGGLDLCGTGLKYVVGAQGVRQRVRIFPWGHGLGRWYADLTRTGRHEKQAETLAREVRDSLEADPEAPVHLVGKSGGTGIVIRALEELPKDSVSSVVLLAPALSPDYDLSKALAAVRKEMVVFWSPFDVVVLGAGTLLFGTIDRKKSVSAGLVGFKLPGSEERERFDAYRKLRQVRWNLGMVTSGYLGGHIGPDNPVFLRKYVLPILTQEPGQSDSKPDES